MKTIQDQVQTFVTTHGLETNAETRFLDLVSEVGELGKELLKSTDYGTITFTPTENLSNELGDILFSLTCLANTLNIDLTTTLNATLKKYETRLFQGGTPSSSI